MLFFGQVILFLCVLVGVALFAYNLYTFFHLKEQFEKESADKIFMDAYRNIKRNKK